LKAAIVSLEIEFDMFKLEKNFKDVNPVFYCLEGVFGVLFIGISIIWWL